jgi:ABC-type Zn uptake system ZnuABC Zn-binding protein ZnuA
MSDKASEDTLAKLHAKVAEKLIKIIEGEEVTPQDLAQAIKFLKDNNIQADIGFSDALKTLKEKVNTKTLPFPVNNTRSN